jgi:hypothetical protein
MSSVGNPRHGARKRIVARVRITRKPIPGMLARLLGYLIGMRRLGVTGVK